MLQNQSLKLYNYHQEISSISKRNDSFMGNKQSEVHRI